MKSLSSYTALLGWPYIRTRTHTHVRTLTYVPGSGGGGGGVVTCIVTTRTCTPSRSDSCCSTSAPPNTSTEADVGRGRLVSSTMITYTSILQQQQPKNNNQISTANNEINKNDGGKKKKFQLKKNLLRFGGKGCGCGCGHELSERQLAPCNHAISKQMVTQSVLCLGGWYCLPLRAYPDQQEFVAYWDEAWLTGCGQGNHLCPSARGTKCLEIRQFV